MRRNPGKPHMLDDTLYQDRILDHYHEPFHRGSCPLATHCHEATNPLCGDRIRIELKVNDEGRIEDAFFQGEGCCVSQSAASILIEHCQGKTVDVVRSMRPTDMLSLFACPLTITRQKCCLLPWRVMQAAIVCPHHAADVPGSASATADPKAQSEIPQR